MHIMNERNYFAVLLLLFLTVENSYGQDFGYDGEKGPTHWGEQYNTCFGKHQSPIDINSLQVRRMNFSPLLLNGFDLLPNQTTITNNGHTVMVTIESEERPTITGGPLNGVYEFNQLHFHWGDNDTMGSEDHIDGQSFPMELHMVFYKKQYRNIRSAMEKSDGLTVLAFFYHVDESEEDNPNYREFTELLLNVTEAETSISFQQTKSINDLLLSELTEYYTYNGSLTTPPCSEIVTWIDFKQSIPLSHAQIDIFRSIRDDEGHHLTHNYRPIQPLGDRIVYYVSPGHFDENLNGLNPPIIEPSQNIDDSKSTTVQHVEDKLMSDDPNVNDDDSIDSPIKNIPEQNDNELNVEMTTTYHPKDRKSKRNSGTKTESTTTKMLILLSTFWIAVVSVQRVRD